MAATAAAAGGSSSAEPSDEEDVTLNVGMNALRLRVLHCLPCLQPGPAQLGPLLRVGRVSDAIVEEVLALPIVSLSESNSGADFDC